MREIRPTVAGSWPVFFGRDARELLLERVEAVDPDRVVLVMDRTVEELHAEEVGEHLPHAYPVETVVFNDGEGNKNLATLEHVAGDLLRAGATDRSLVLCVGGASVLHMGGLAASLLGHGIRFASLPTTTFAQWRAVNTRRVAIHFTGETDRLGLHRAPAFSLVDPHFLSTESPRSRTAGLVEFAREALALGGEFHARAARTLSTPGFVSDARIEATLAACLEHALAAGALDPEERRAPGLARYGEPAARALASLSDGRLEPSEAVFHAMRIAGEIARARGLLSDSEHARHDALLRALGLSEAPIPEHVRTDRFIYKMHGNDKTVRDDLPFALLTEIGRFAGATGDEDSVPTTPVSDDEAARAFDRIRAA